MVERGCSPRRAFGSGQRRLSPGACASASPLSFAQLRVLAGVVAARHDERRTAWLLVASSGDQLWRGMNREAVNCSPQAAGSSPVADTLGSVLRHSSDDDDAVQLKTESKAAAAAPRIQPVPASSTLHGLEAAGLSLPLPPFCRAPIHLDACLRRGCRTCTLLRGSGRVCVVCVTM